MPSQTDLDQGGTNREWARLYMGPSVGWIDSPSSNVLPITAAGTYTIDASTSLVTVNVSGAVTINLPSALQPVAGAQAQPRLFAKNPITIIDIGGNATAHPITIQPFGSENIMGLSSIQITVNYGAFTLKPIPAQSGWSNISP